MRGRGKKKVILEFFFQPGVNILDQHFLGEKCYLVILVLPIMINEVCCTYEGSDDNCLFFRSY